jgi:DNA-binding transcriptional ArsR family regulator
MRLTRSRYMAFQSENNIQDHEEVIDHFHSTVVEGIAVLSSLLNSSSNKKKANQVDLTDLLAEISNDSKLYIQRWENSAFDFSLLLNFLLPCPVYHNMKLFLNKVSNMTDAEFLFYFFGEDIPFSQLDEILLKPSSIYSLEPSIWWQNEHDKKEWLELVSAIGAFRANLSRVLLEISDSSWFIKSIESHKTYLHEQIMKLQAFNMEGLPLAQYVMGKPFRRTSLYEVYYFIPSIYLVHERIRIFDTKTCLIIYNITTSSIDVKETSAEYELKLKALSDRNRLLILRLLSSRKEYGAKIAEYLGITTATVSHHLELLKKAGFISEEKIGTIKYFSLNQRFTEKLLNEVESFIIKKR